MVLHPTLRRLLQRGSSFLGAEYPIMCGAMTWVSEPGLVSAVCNAGGFASLAGGNTPPAVLKEQVSEVRRRTDRPFAVNLITIAPAYREQLALLDDLKLPYVIFAGSFPREREIETARRSGAKVLCFASTLSIAERMIKFGTDALILEGSEAGGHIGHVSLVILLQQVLFEVAESLPVFVAGGLATGRMMANLMVMGAAGVQLGTRFVMADECIAHPRFKEAFSKAEARDAVVSPQYDSKLPVVAVRALRNKGTTDFGALQIRLLKDMADGLIGREAAQLEVERFWIGALRRAVIDGDVERGSLMAGQSVGLVRKIMPVRAIIEELLTDASAEMERVHELFHADDPASPRA